MCSNCKKQIHSYQTISMSCYHSVYDIMSKLEDLMTRIERCDSDADKESAMHQWTCCCFLNNQSAPHTMDFIFAKPWRRLTLTTIEDAMQQDMAMLNERIKKEQESLAKAQKLHDDMIEKMKEGKKRAKPDDDDDSKIIIVRMVKEEDVVVVENKRAKH